jgi:hypothetical protein
VLRLQFIQQVELAARVEAAVVAAAAVLTDLLLQEQAALAAAVASLFTIKIEGKL